MRTQARGLARAVAERVIEKQPTRSGPLAWLRGKFGAGALGGEFMPPWPDILITCGRRSVPYAVAIKRASGGRTLTIHVQDPRTHRGRFDLIIAMAHDRLAEGPKVIKISTALHDITAASLAEAAGAWSMRLSPLGHPLIGVIVGGDLRGRPFTPKDADRLIQGLKRLRGEIGAGLAITPSRRTPSVVRNQIAQAFANDPSVFIWDLSGENPYRAILALADRLVVTTDSVSMVSEAIATGHLVDLLDLDFPRHRGFVQNLIDQGLARRFDGMRGDFVPQRTPDITKAVAARVLKLIQARTGADG